MRRLIRWEALELTRTFFNFDLEETNTVSLSILHLLFYSQRARIGII